MFEVVRYRYVVISCFASWFVSELPIGREIESTKNTTNQKRRLIWYLSTQLSINQSDRLAAAAALKNSQAA